MDAFYNAPVVPVLAAFVIAVLLMALGLIVLIQLVRMPLPREMKTAIASFLIGFSLLWFPIWFIYGVITNKFH